MPTWKIEEPETLEFDRVTRLRVRTIRGRLSVVGIDERPRVEVSEVRGGPLTVRHDEDGALEVGYDDWARPGFLSWVASRRRWRRQAVVSIAVPRDCPVDLQVISSSVVASGLRARVGVRVVSGDITLAGLAGPVDAETVSGSVEAHAIGAGLRMRTVSGDITLAEGFGGTVQAETVSGAIACDLSTTVTGDVRLGTVSGDITIRVPDPSDLQVRLQTTSGQVSTAFPDLRRSSQPGRQLAEGLLGAGTARLQAKATSGDVALLRRGREDRAGVSP
jgi:Putative adhesin